MPGPYTRRSDGDTITPEFFNELQAGVEALAAEYAFLGYGQGGETYTNRDNYLHVGCATAGAIVRGMWLYRYD